MVNYIFLGASCESLGSTSGPWSIFWWPTARLLVLVLLLFILKYSQIEHTKWYSLKIRDQQQINLMADTQPGVSFAVYSMLIWMPILINNKIENDWKRAWIRA